MKLRNLIAPIALISAGTSFGASGIYDASVFTTVSGGAPLTFYDIGAVTANPDFNGSDLGAFNLGSSLQLGGQQKSFKNGGSDVLTHTIYWKISGAFVGVNMPFQWNQGDVGAPGNLNNAGDQQWGGDVQGGNGSLVLSSNVLSGLTPGNYTLEVYSEITTNGNNADVTIGNTNGINNYKATFTVVPEPTSMALGLLGTALLLRRRRI